MHAVGEAVVTVGIHICIQERRRRVAARDDLFGASASERIAREVGAPVLAEVLGAVGLISYGNFLASAAAVGRAIGGMAGRSIRQALLVLGPLRLLNFAAFALVGESMTNPKKYFHNNFINALKLADAAVECGVKKFVFSSTCATYGEPVRVPLSPSAGGAAGVACT